MKRELAIEKIEGWARWEIGDARDTEETGGSTVTGVGFLPGDQADHLTVEIALNEYSGRSKAGGLRALLLHMYGEDSLPESFDPVRGLEVDGRKLVRSFLLAFGWRPESFSRAAASRFVRFLGGRL